VHADKQAAAPTITARPAINVLGKMPPAAQVEISDTEISPFGDLQRFLQGRQERFIYVVEYSWHYHRNQVGDGAVLVNPVVATTSSVLVHSVRKHANVNDAMGPPRNRPAQCDNVPECPA
jgi:hypothetical protein